MLKLIADATDTDTSLVTGGDAPQLEVAAFDVQGAISAGHTFDLVLRLRNRGVGSAFRVVATTRSSVSALHGQRFEFGVLKPGEEKIRKRKIDFPSTETGTDAMVVLVVDEANGYAPPNASRRWSFVVAQAEVATQAKGEFNTNCMIREYPTAHPTIGVGENVVVRCVVRNSGTTAATALVSVAVAKVQTAAPATRIDPGGRVTLEIPFSLPRDLVVGADIQFVVATSDTAGNRVGQTTIAATVAKPKLCVVGGLTRKQYYSKIAALKDARGAGSITQAEFDHYDSELVSCLK